MSDSAARLFNLLGNKTGEVAVVESEYEELVRIFDHSTRGVAWELEWISDGGQEVIVIADIQGVFGHAVDHDVLSKCQPFQLGWNQMLIHVSRRGIELFDHVEERS